MKSKILTIVMMVLCLTVVSTVPVLAEEIGNHDSTDSRNYGAPIDEKIYYDDDLGATVIEQTYFLADAPEITARSKSGKGWFKNTKQLTWDQGDRPSTTFWVEGYFVWGNGDVSVSSPKKGYTAIPSNASVVSENLKHDTGQYLGVFNKFAYVTYSFSVKNRIGMTRSDSVTIRVSESGNMI